MGLRFVSSRVSRFLGVRASFFIFIIGEPMDAGTGNTVRVPNVELLREYIFPSGFFHLMPGGLGPEWSLYARFRLAIIKTPENAVCI